MIALAGIEEVGQFVVGDLGVLRRQVDSVRGHQRHLAVDATPARTRCSDEHHRHDRDDQREFMAATPLLLPTNSKTPGGAYEARFSSIGFIALGLVRFVLECGGRRQQPLVAGDIRGLKPRPVTNSGHL